MEHGYDFSDEHDAFDFNSASQESDDRTMEMIEALLHQEEVSPLNIEEYFMNGWVHPTNKESLRMKSNIFRFISQWLPVWFKERSIGVLGYVHSKAVRLECMLARHFQSPVLKPGQKIPLFLCFGLKCMKTLGIVHKAIMKLQDAESQFSESPSWPSRSFDEPLKYPISCACLPTLAIMPMEPHRVFRCM